MRRARPYLKAAAGAVVAGLTALGTALTDGAVTPTEWCTVGVAVLTAGGAVYGTPWLPKDDDGAAS